MSQDEIEKLRDFAECIELYAHRNRLLLRLEVGDWEAAHSLCLKAMDHCAGQITGDANVRNESLHRRNLENLGLLELGLRRLMEAGDRNRPLKPAI